jgi:Uncharacterized protein conserved in bacteria (DUF2219)
MKMISRIGGVLVVLLSICSSVFGQVLEGGLLQFPLMQAPHAGLCVVSENDAFQPYRFTDEAYTSGNAVAYVSASKSVVKTNLPTDNWRYSYKTRIGLAQLVFTPNNIKLLAPDTTQRPYAGLLLAAWGQERVYANGSLQLTVQAGVLGPMALGAEFQTFIHAVGQFKKPLGWHLQLRSQPVAQVLLFGKRQLNHRAIHLWGQVDLGTLWNKTGGGLGWDLGQEQSNFRGNLTIGAFAIVTQGLLGGGLRSDNVYVLPHSKINQVLGVSEARLAYSFSMLVVELAQTLQTAEYATDRRFHFRGRLSLFILFND